MNAPTPYPQYGQPAYPPPNIARPGPSTTTVWLAGVLRLILGAVGGMLITLAVKDNGDDGHRSGGGTLIEAVEAFVLVMARRSGTSNNRSVGYAANALQDRGKVAAMRSATARMIRAHGGVEPGS